jgi:hypothetical protein
VTGFEETRVKMFEAESYRKRNYLIDDIITKYKKGGFDVKCFICTYSGICEAYFNSHRHVFPVGIEDVLTLYQGDVGPPLDVVAGEVPPKAKRELKLDLFETHVPVNAYTGMDFQRRKIARVLGAVTLSSCMMLLIDDGPQNRFSTKDDGNKRMVQFRVNGVPEILGEAVAEEPINFGEPDYVM